MTDTRFTTLCDNASELIDVVDVDGIGDIEALLMILLMRPVAVRHSWEGEAETLSITVHGDGESVVRQLDFPVCMIDVARPCAEAATALNPGVAVGADVDSSVVAAMGDNELVTLLQQSLGKVRIFNMVADD